MRKSKFRKGFVVAIIVLFVGASVVPSNIGTLGKKTTFTETYSRGYIQDLIDNASNGDIIYIPSGIYNESIVINKTISLVGEDKNTTIIDGGGSGDVVYVSADWVNFSGFTIQNSGSAGYPNYDAGVEIGSNYSAIIGNLVTGNNRGIWISANNNSVIDNEIISNNAQGIEIYHSRNNTIVANNVSSNTKAGIQFDGSSNNTIKGNTITSNSWHGICLDDSSNSNIIISNNISSNDNGIRTFDFSDGNIIYHNNLINNTQNAFDECSNTWDNGYPSGGNYWDDYTGEDNDGDGIGDTLYSITGGSNQDNYPLMYPWYPTHPDIVYVDDDYDNSTSGFGYDRFNRIQYGINEIPENGTVYVYTGTYTEGLGTNSEYVHIHKSLDLIGENKENTVINCPLDGEFVGVLIGVGFEGVNNVIVSGFTVRGVHQKGAGIVSYVGCNNITIEDCITHSFWEGIKCKTSSNVTVRNCISYNNSRDGGIAVQMGSNFVEIYGCNIYSNSYGIRVKGGDNVNCIIYHNNLINNTQNACDESNNTWDNGYPSGGNYWSDYTEDDLNSGPNQNIPGPDGIGDTPYNITGGDNQDLYPLMHPFEQYYILNISAPSEVDEGEFFNVVVTSIGGTAIPNATVEFNDELKLTDSDGRVYFIAPQVGEDTYYDIIANKEGYTGDTETILVKDVPVEFVSTFIFGRIDNLTTGGDVITFEAVNIRVITLKFPPYSTPYTSGELTISKNPFGFLGALFGVQLIFAFCGLADQPYTPTISMNIWSTDNSSNEVVWMVSGVEGPPVEIKEVEMILLNESGQPQPNAEITFNDNTGAGHISPGDTFTVVAPYDGNFVFMLTHKSSGATIYKSSLTHY